MTGPSFLEGELPNVEQRDELISKLFSGVEVVCATKDVVNVSRPQENLSYLRKSLAFIRG